MRYALGGSAVEIEDWDDLVRSAEEGLLNENAYCELKKALPPREFNVELARDLASLTVHGGLFIVGIGDAGANKAGEVVGVKDADRVHTRLTQIADGLVEPSVVCSVSVLQHPADPTLGCVLVEVPPSSTAPHRADERYWGRTSEGKRVLSDPEVAHLFSQRRQRRDDFATELRALVSSSQLVPDEARETSQLHLIARPGQPTGLSSPPWRGESAISLIAAAPMPQGRYGGTGLATLRQSAPHPDGIVAHQPFGDPRFETRESETGRLLIRDEGGVDLSLCGVTWLQRGGEAPGYYVDLAHAAVCVEQTSRLVAVLSDRISYNGTWRMGVHVDRLKEGKSLRAYGAHGKYAPMFLEETYERLLVATGEEIRDKPQQVTSRLLEGLARGLGEAALLPYNSIDDLVRRY